MNDPTAKTLPCFLRFGHAYETRPHGGDWILESLGRSLPDKDTASASIEFSTAPAREMTVMEGPVAGSSWAELAFRFGDDLLGARGRALLDGGLDFEVSFVAADIGDSPICMIGSSGSGSSGQMGAMVIMETRPGAVLYYGRRRNLAEDRFIACLRKSHGPEILQEHQAESGGVVLIPPGLPYAPGRGILSYMVSAEKAEAAKRGGRRSGTRVKGNVLTTPISTARAYIKTRGRLQGTNAITWLYASELFCTVRLDLRSEWADAGPGVRDSFVVLSGVQGRALVLGDSETEVIDRGTTLVVSASCKSFRINPAEEGAVILKTWLADPGSEIEKPLREHGCSRREIEGLYGFFGKK